ncbi:MAG: nucleotidyltransferase family protein [Xanthomonadales bacterium]|nr:nucleotidyltransferase family protein [Gammaproteobacteria bacterium]NNE06829.1 nucleotidyltransferase family protein [Xanthomonadales bacterium]NNL96076.1 nucleotidyltransferase family protein [Xanthomonadales bacterium]
MRAMILSAGRGERLRPLTDTTPKPLVEVAGKPLLFYHLERLAGAGFREIVINLAHLGKQITDAVGDGSRWGLNVHYSQEPDGALETGGGIAQARPLLGTAPFLVVNGDIWTDFPFIRLRAVKCDFAHLVLVPVPPGKNDGDFHLDGARVRNSGSPSHTFSGISVYHPRLFESAPGGRWSIVPLLRETVDRQFVSGELYNGRWHDTGTPESLEMARAAAR